MVGTARTMAYGLVGAVGLLAGAARAQPLCYGDYDGSGGLDLFDFLAFVNAFNAQQPSADCDDNGAFDLFDFLCFVNSFNAGCPTMLRDASCYPSTDCTAGQPDLRDYAMHGYSAWEFSIFNFSINTQCTITAFAGIGNSYGGNTHWSDIFWYANIFSSIDAFLASPTTGDVVSNVSLSESHEALVSNDFYVTLTSDYPIDLQVGSYLIVVYSYEGGWFWRETSTELGSDIYSYDLGLPDYWWYNQYPFFYATGSEAVDVWGY